MPRLLELVAADPVGVGELAPWRRSQPVDAGTGVRGAAGVGLAGGVPEGVARRVVDQVARRQRQDAVGDRRPRVSPWPVARASCGRRRRWRRRRRCSRRRPRGRSSARRRSPQPPRGVGEARVAVVGVVRVVRQVGDLVPALPLDAGALKSPISADNSPAGTEPTGASRALATEVSALKISADSRWRRRRRLGRPRPHARAPPRPPRPGRRAPGSRRTAARLRRVPHRPRSPRTTAAAATAAAATAALPRSALV